MRIQPRSRRSSCGALSAFRGSLLSLLAVLALVPLAEAQQAGKTGQIDLLYIRGEWSDRAMALTDSEWQSRLDGIHTFAEDYWVFHSAGVITGFASTLTARLQLAGPAPTVADPADPQDVRSEMIALAQAAGFVLGDFDHVVLSYPSVPHTFSFGGLGTPGTVWMPGSDPWGPGFVHEMGHAFGVGHASHWEGGASILPGVHREGRDGLFMMGSEGNGIIGGRSTINMPMRYRMGHVAPGNVELANTSGVVRLYEFELPAPPQGKLTAVRVPVGGSVPGDWWISFAPTMVERWANFDSAGFGQGVIVQQLTGSITRSLDFTPQSQGGIGTNEEDYIDSRDGALQIGSDFTFPGTEVTIEPLQTGTTDGLRWIEVDIDLGPDSGPLLLHEEFDHYAAGDIDGQPGQGLGLTGQVWSQSQGSGSFNLVPGLSGAHAVALSSNGERGDLRIPHEVGFWGLGKLWFSCLYNESNTVGHFWANGSSAFAAAVGHPWHTRTWAVNNTTSPGFLGFGLGETHRLVALFDWDRGSTTLWIDPLNLPVSDPAHPNFAPAAHKQEVPPASNRWIFLSFEAGSEGTVDDIRIGTTFDSVVEDVSGPVGDAYCSAAPNSVSPTGALIAGSGSASLGAAQLTLVTSDVPPGNSGLYFFGSNPVMAPFGDGFRCVGGAILRLPLIAADSAGSATYDLSFAAFPETRIDPGSVWNFQLWYRDPAAGMSGFNLSNALEIQFTP